MKNPLKRLYNTLFKRKKKQQLKISPQNPFGINFHTWTPMIEEQAQGRTFRDHSFQLVTYDLETGPFNREAFLHLYHKNATDDSMPPMSVHVHTHNDPTTLELIQTKRHPTTPERAASEAQTFTDRIRKEKVTKTAKRLLELARKDGYPLHKMIGIGLGETPEMPEEVRQHRIEKTLENRVRTVFELMDQAGLNIDDRKEPEPVRNTQETREVLKEVLSETLSTQNLNSLLDRSIEHHTQQIDRLVNAFTYNDRQRSSDQEFPTNHIEITPQGQEAEFRHLVEHHATLKPRTVQEITHYLDRVYRANDKAKRTKLRTDLKQETVNDHTDQFIGQEGLTGVSCCGDDHLSDGPNDTLGAKRTVLEEFVESHTIIIGKQKDDDVIDVRESIVNYFDQISLGERRELATQLRYYIESRLSESLQERGHETVSLSVYSVFVGQSESLSTSFVCDVNWPAIAITPDTKVPNRTVIEVKLTEQTFDDLLLQCLESESPF